MSEVSGRECGLRIAIMPGVEIRFSVVADQAAEEESAFALVID